MSAVVTRPRVTFDLSALTGTWKNTNAASRGVVRLDIAANGDVLRISAQAAESWGTAIAHPYSVDGFESRQALAFNTTFELGHADVRLQANIKAGVLVIAFLTAFRVSGVGDRESESRRSNYFTREFYYRSSQ